MRRYTLPAKTRIQPPAHPINLTGGVPAVLLIHGFTGHPGELHFLADRIHRSGATVSVPRLPGHGTNREDFLRTGWREWLDSAVEHYLDLSSRHSAVYVGGLSMGGVISLILASLFEVPGLLLYSPALKVSGRPLGLARLLAPFIPSVRMNRPLESSDPQLQEIEREYHQDTWIRPASNLRRLQNIARRRLGTVTAPILVIVSKQDHTVPTSVLDIVTQHTASSRVWPVVLEESGHVLTNGVEKETVAEHSVTWLHATIAGEPTV